MRFLNITTNERRLTDEAQNEGYDSLSDYDGNATLTVLACIPDYNKTPDENNQRHIWSFGRLSVEIPGHLLPCYDSRTGK